MSGKEQILVKTKRPPRPRRQLPDLCRICLTGSPSMILLTEFLDKNLNVLIIDALEKVMGCHVKLVPDKPNHVCSMCMSLLRISYNLRCQFDQTQSELFINKEEIIKKKSLINNKNSKREVEIIVGKENYSLGDILIVEDDDNKEDYTNLLNNLSKNITIQVFNEKQNLKKINKRTFEDSVELITPDGTVPELEDYETIVIQAVSDTEENYENVEEIVEPFKQSTKKRGGRKSKYPDSLMEKINSLIIEGDCEPQNEETLEKIKEKSDETIKDEITVNGCKRRKKASNDELQKIEKFIIYGPGPEPTTQLNEIETTLHKCPFCSIKLPTRFQVKRHIRMVHTTEDLLLRKEKKEIDKIKMRVRLQQIRKEYKKNPLLCQICGYVSKSPGGARYHLITHGDKMYNCNYCTKKFYTPSHKKNHEQVFHERKYVKRLCPICGVSKNSTSALGYHMKSHKKEERKFACHICGIKFLIKSVLNNHLKRHNDDRQHFCNYCDKSFYTSNELKKHIMTHTGERPYQCKYCEKGFVTTFNRKIHTMTHEGPYQCQFCHRTFIDTDSLQFHMKSKHGIKAEISLEDEEDQDVEDKELDENEENCDDEQFLEERLLQELDLLKDDEEMVEDEELEEGGVIVEDGNFIFDGGEDIVC